MVWLPLFAVCLLAAGCRTRLEDTYGQRAGAEKSVNGTRVLGEMFEKAGHRVLSWGRLSPRLENRADCIVWFPDNFNPPSDETAEWLESWLDAAPGRVLIYVGRDFDAACWYWDKIEPAVPPESREHFEEYRRRAQWDFKSRRIGLPPQQTGCWFDIDRSLPQRSVRTLSGKRDWLEGIDPTKLDIELRARLVPPDNTEILLESEGDMLVGRQAIGKSRLILVANGSFLLNLPLVNHEHRKLAGKLIDAVGPEEKTVVFLETGEGGPSIVDNDPTSIAPTGVEIFNIWPTNWILLHLAVVGILFCFWRFPIFGLATPGKQDRLSDFGKHLDAVAGLLKQSGDEEYARGRVKHYLQKIKPSE
ncbi:MAG: hypothetical protein JW719_05395 [Pirellulales bacterium]|nr:hypothetical protein [Pirellulales bacterium]